MAINKGYTKKILYNGELELVDWLGSDVTVVNSARVSFGKRVSDWSDKEDGLVRYLVKNKHTSPFRHPQIQFRVKAPETTARQWFKHCIGADYTFKDTGWNEISGRYVEVEDFHIPSIWRRQSTDNKQGSAGPLNHVDQMTANSLYQKTINDCYKTYQTLLDMGIAKEQARFVLPISQNTQWFWTASFQAVMNFIELRDEKHAQFEIREYAKVMKDMVSELFPNLTRIWFEETN